MSRETDRGGDRLTIGGPARANLLPPEVGLAAQGRVMRRNAVAVVVLAVLLVAAGYAGVAFLAGGAQGQLDAANQRTQDLLVEQAKYSEVRGVKTLLQTATAARMAATSTEIDWKDYLGNIQAILPTGTLVTNVVANTATPLAGFSQPSVPLQGTRIGELTFTATSASLPDVETWLQSLAKLTGYVDATPGSVNLQADGTYQASITMHINKDALLLRYDDAAREARDKAIADREAANEATSSPSPSPNESDSTDGGE